MSVGDDGRGRGRSRASLVPLSSGRLICTFVADGVRAPPALWSSLGLLPPRHRRLRFPLPSPRAAPALGPIVGLLSPPRPFLQVDAGPTWEKGEQIGSHGPSQGGGSGWSSQGRAARGRGRSGAERNHDRTGAKQRGCRRRRPSPLGGGPGGSVRCDRDSSNCAGALENFAFVRFGLFARGRQRACPRLAKACGHRQLCCRRRPRCRCCSSAKGIAIASALVSLCVCNRNGLSRAPRAERPDGTNRCKT